MPPRQIALVCTLDAAYAPAAAALLHSVASRVSARWSLRVFIVHDGANVEIRRRLARVADRLAAPTSLVWLKPNLDSLDGIRMPDRRPGCEWPRTVLLRLLVGSMLPRTLRRVIYLDVDTIVRADVAELWTAALHGRPVGATQNHTPATCGEHWGVMWRAPAVTPSTRYFNSGVLLVDLEAWRRERVEERAVTFLLQHGPALAYPDQDTLNAVLPGGWTPLRLGWNVPPSVYALSDLPDAALRQDVSSDEWSLLNDPMIVHYTGERKPWMPDCRHPLRALFQHHLRASGWELAAEAQATV